MTFLHMEILQKILQKKLEKPILAMLQNTRSTYKVHYISRHYKIDTRHYFKNKIPLIIASKIGIKVWDLYIKR